MNPIPNRRLVSIALSLACGLSLAFASPAMAQSGDTPAGIEIPENLTREEVRDLVARLSDDEVRELIIQQLDKLAVSGEQASEESLYFQNLDEGLDKARDALTSSFDLKQKPLQTLAGKIGEQVSAGGEVGGGRLLLQLVVLLAAGGAAAWLARGLLRRKSASLPQEPSLRERLDHAAYETAAGALGIAAFAVGASIAVEAMTSEEILAAAQMLWYQAIWLIVSVAAVMLIASRILSPKSARLRLAAMSDGAAREAWIWTLVLTLSLVAPTRLGHLAAALGASQENLLLFAVLVGMIFILLVIALLIRLRSYGARLIAADGEAGIFRQSLARVWWIVAALYVVVIWLMSVGKRAATGESSLLPGLGSLVLVVAIPYFDRGLRWFIAWYFAPPKQAYDGAAAATPAAGQADAVAQVAAPAESESAGAPAPVPNYHAVALRYGRVLMVLAILAIFARLWHIDVAALSAQLVGERFARASFDIAITILLTWALWGVIRIAIERKLAEDKGPEGASDEAEAGGVGGTRLGTVLPLIRAFIQITLIVMAVLIGLSSLGVNIGPLIAGAGVVGLAIGFGAQTLVRDIVSGFFYLVDDAFRIGEYVVIDQTRGTVEKISIRSFQLRHHNGPVHTIPYGEIRTLTNWSRDWAIMKCELRVPFETDIEKVRKIIKKIGIDMMEDPQWGPLMLAPVKSQGVNRMDDSALIIRFKFTAVPGQQFLIRREAYARIQRAFEEQGIHFAPRRVLVEATTPQKAIEAAAAAIDNEGEQKPSSPDEP